MELYINLNNQRNLKRTKKALRILALVTLLLSVITAGLLMFGRLEGSIFLLWFYMFYFLIFSGSLYMQSNGIHPFDLLGKSYLKINEDGVECKLDMFKKKVISFQWKDVDFISIKLFEIKVKVNNVQENLNLEKLSDENLQLVKGVFQKYRSQIVEKELSIDDF